MRPCCTIQGVESAPPLGLTGKGCRGGGVGKSGNWSNSGLILGNAGKVDRSGIWGKAGLPKDVPVVVVVLPVVLGPVVGAP
jgi:hypothetical protein